MNKKTLIVTVSLLVLTMFVMLYGGVFAQVIVTPEGAGPEIILPADDQTISPDLPIRAEYYNRPKGDRVCARGNVGVIWAFIGEGRDWWWWFYSPWEPLADDCFMDLQLQIGDTNIAKMASFQRIVGNINCTGTNRLLTCTAVGSDGAQTARVRLEGVNQGATVLTMYDPSTGISRAYNLFIVPGYMYFLGGVSTGK